MRARAAAPAVAFAFAAAFAFALTAALVAPSTIGRAEPLDQSFPAGAGSRFNFTSPLARGELVVSIAASTAHRVTVECFFTAAGRELWEQFTLELSSGAPAVTEGYLLSADGAAPERLPPELLKGLDDVALADFLLSDRAQLERDKRGVDQLTVAASRAPLTCARYQRTLDGQTLTYWISDAARPIGLVKLESRGNKPQQNYSLELAALLRHVGRKIDPARAIPITRETRALLQTSLR